MNVTEKHNEEPRSTNRFMEFAAQPTAVPGFGSVTKLLSTSDPTYTFNEPTTMGGGINPTSYVADPKCCDSCS